MSNKILVSIGLLLWVAYILFSPYLETGGILEQLFLFAPLVIVPIALPLLRVTQNERDEPHIAKIILRFYLFAALGAFISFLFPSGHLAAVFAFIWCVFTFFMAGFGFYRLLSRGMFLFEEICIDIGLIYFSVGGLWLVASRLGLQPLGFDDIIVLLTAIHFHYAGLIAPLLAGMIGRIIPLESKLNKFFRIGAIGIIFGIPILAIGITLSPTLEVIAAIILALSVVSVFSIILICMLPKFSNWKMKSLAVIVAASTIWAMTFATLYAIGEFLGEVIVSIPYVANTHGVANAFGFALCGLILFRLVNPSSKWFWLNIPFSQLYSKGKCGADYFQRMNLIPESPQSPKGLVDNLDEYKRNDFDTSKVHKDIRSFYERTSEYELIVVPDWKAGFRIGGKIYRSIANRIGQMCLPTERQDDGQLINSQIVDINDSVDGRKNVRGWIRTYRETGEPVYIAAYSNHTNKDSVYMNIAFPLPGGNLTSVLYLNTLEGGGSQPLGVSLTSKRKDLVKSDEGVYFYNKRFQIRLPIDETIEVWTPEMESHIVDINQEDSSVSVVAKHTMWIFGIKFLTLDYLIKKA